ncbi:MAG: hypothetical protein SPJ13_03540 [Bacteroidales bacterium]|nr:hypothetical protein [Bacteroidales bacterium]
MTMSWFLIIVMLFVGTLLLTLEIVALPGFVAGAFGLGIWGVGVWQAFVSKGATAGWIAMFASIFVFVLLLAVFLKAKTWRVFSLNEQVDGKMNIIDESSIAVGTRGTTVTRCAPAGKALFASGMEEVHSQGAFIDENKQVEVIEIEGYKITVREVE